MNKREVEKYIPLSINIIKEVMDNMVNKDKETLELPKEFKGYISSFGAGIVQSGLLPTVAFFEKEDNNAKSDRSKIIDMIFRMLDKDKFYQYKNNKKKLLDYLLKKEDIEEVKEEIINIAIALKLAMRTFKFIDKEKVGE